MAHARPMEPTALCPKTSSRRLAIVIIQETADPLALSHTSCRSGDHLRSRQQAIIETLMIPLHMIMDDELSNRPSQRIFSKEDHPIEAAFSNCADEAFGV